MANRAIQGMRAQVLAIVGQHDQALAEIERLLDTPGSYLSRWMLTLDPRWDFMRDDERFNELIKPEDITKAMMEQRSGDSS